ncbi:hypothetical protein SRABI128_05376 [Microbacterium sp. Bi128]|nr:hypothetical protein SRABI128_05376 [Microbacterium sp. Bi128]
MDLKQPAIIGDEYLLDRRDERGSDTSAAAAGVHCDQCQLSGLREVAIHKCNPHDFAAHHGEK